MTTVAARHHTAGIRGDPASRQPGTDGNVVKRGAKLPSHWSRDAKVALARCENFVNSFLGSSRGKVADDLLDRSGVQMAKLAQWCLDEGVDDCWKTIWKLSVWTLSKVQTRVNNDGLHICDQAVAHARKWILPPGHRKQRIGAPWLEWCSHCLSLLCWVTRTISASGRGRRRRHDAAKHLKFIPDGVSCYVAEGRLHPEGANSMSDWLFEQIVAPICSNLPGGAVTYVLLGLKTEYIGSSLCARKGAKLSGCLPRFWEHLCDFRKKTPGKYNLKERSFRATQESNLAVLELQRETVTMAISWERVLLRTWRPRANTCGVAECGRRRVLRDRQGKRRRPPRHLRTPRLPDGHQGRLDAIVHADAQRPHLRKEAWSQRQIPLNMISGASQKTYRWLLDMQVSTAGTYGPLPMCKTLALSFLADAKWTVGSKILFPSEVYAYRAAEMIRHIQRPGIRSRMMGRIRLVLHSEGWPSMKMRVLTIPRELQAAEIKGALNSAMIKSGVPLERRKWLLSRTMIMQGAKRTFATTHWTMINVCKTTDIRPLLPSTHDATKMEHAKKNDKYWRLENPRSWSETRAALQDVLLVWRRKMGKSSSLRLCHVYSGLSRMPATQPTQDWIVYTSDLVAAGPERCWVQDDKAKSSAWNVCTKKYVCALHEQLQRDGQHWVPSDQSRDAAGDDVHRIRRLEEYALSMDTAACVRS